MVSPREPDRLTLPLRDCDHCQGSSTAKITLVQYGDYQCPGCQVAHGILPFIREQLGDQLQFVFRHFPQPHIHPEAYHAAEAAEAAAAQNKFWEMHTHLLEHQSHLADHHLVEYAIVLHLDVNRFLQEMTGDYHIARVQADIDSGLQSGVIKTPTFFVNGLKYGDDRSLESLLERLTNSLTGDERNSLDSNRGSY